MGDINTDFYVYQQEEEQSLVNVLGENVDKMQLTRRILDLKQVSIVKEKKLWIISRIRLYMLNNYPGVKLYTFPCVSGLYYSFVGVSKSFIYGRE